jgi:nucleoside-diphosphate kinase
MTVCAHGYVRTGIEVGRNICHGSDAVESAKAEIALWFPEGLNKYSSCEEAWVTEF